MGRVGRHIKAGRVHGPRRRRRARFGSAGVVGDLGLRVRCFRRVSLYYMQEYPTHHYTYSAPYIQEQNSLKLESNNRIQRLLLFFSRVLVTRLRRTGLEERSDMIEEERATSRKAHGATRSRITSG